MDRRSFLKVCSAGAALAGIPGSMLSAQPAAHTLPSFSKEDWEKFGSVAFAYPPRPHYVIAGPRFFERLNKLRTEG